MGGMSRTKGKVGEREVAALLKSHGIEARRGQQYAGGGDSPDVVHSLTGIHIEVKRTERFALDPAMNQAQADMNEGEIPTVWHRSSGNEWVVVIHAEDFIALAKKAKANGIT